ncbi:inosine/xanthosine triphosphatase [Candidatus Falkowbacteria bacterium CG10_big_fil_rev_8_21_14_0_10_43_11]|uniref:inosine/xanthosine triphosphatase n=1 Tax=Candidatus Falkowbacteria bacterium CG10_big_fil_rev_8_21_14_0_10_43_11 TaxID=1974568 RepID=A0A2M6WME2_9BACT|nr:MAG: inosine/xanthosine triphosphatase [Candidatus Falkowbacteria bacterium CG10_big_fil_rev_8_21_14_0_10_43_11]
MKIIVGSTNPVKIDAVREIIKEYDFLAGAEVSGVKVASEISEQPLSLEEIIQGAINRAKKAWQDCEYSVGIESGLMSVPKTKTGYMDITACVIYDGQETSVGLSSVFEQPLELTKIVLKAQGKIDISHAAKAMGLVQLDNIGYEGGMMGLLTKGRVNRKDYTKEAIRTALIQLENKELY